MYVYIYLNPLKIGTYNYGKFHFDYEPFYIGLGKIDSHVKQASYNKEKSFKDNVILKILKENQEPIRYKLYENITLYSAKRLEKCLIKLIGRKDLIKGPLVNLTDGGDGCQNSIVSKENREKARLRAIELWDKGIFKPQYGTSNPFFNKHHTEETIQKIKKSIFNGKSRKGENNSNFNNKWTEEQKKEASIRNKENHKHLHGDNNPAKRKEVREKISESKMGLKNPNAYKWRLVTPDEEIIIIEGGIKKALKNYGLTYQKMKYNVENEIYYSKDGWKMTKILES
jgi:hypothetical protein